MYYDDQKINDLFAQGRAETDEAARKEIYSELQKEIQDLAAFYPIVSNDKILVVNNRIQGIEEAGLVPVYTFEDTYYLKMAESRIKKAGAHLYSLPFLLTTDKRRANDGKVYSKTYIERNPSASDHYDHLLFSY